MRSFVFYSTYRQSVDILSGLLKDHNMYFIMDIDLANASGHLAYVRADVLIRNNSIGDRIFISTTRITRTIETVSLHRGNRECFGIDWANKPYLHMHLPYYYQNEYRYGSVDYPTEMLTGYSGSIKTRLLRLYGIIVDKIRSTTDRIKIRNKYIYVTQEVRRECCSKRRRLQL